MGNCFSLQKEHETALRFFQRALQIDPHFTYAYTLCGHEYFANEDFDKSLAYYRHAITQDPRHYNAWCGKQSAVHVFRCWLAPVSSECAHPDMACIDAPV